VQQYVYVFLVAEEEYYIYAPTLVDAEETYRKEVANSTPEYLRRQHV